MNMSGQRLIWKGEILLLGGGKYESKRLDRMPDDMLGKLHSKVCAKHILCSYPQTKSRNGGLGL